MAFAIAHAGPRDSQRMVVLDRVGEVRAPLSPHAVVARFVPILKSYGIHTVTGDRYADEWPREVFREHGILYRPSRLSRTDLYRNFLPLINGGRVELLDHPRLVAQLVALERRETPSGNDSITHPPGVHDDLANAVAGAVVAAAKREYRLFPDSPAIPAPEQECSICGGCHLKGERCPYGAPTAAEVIRAGSAYQ